MAYDPQVQCLLVRDENASLKEASTGVDSSFWMPAIPSEHSPLRNINTWVFVQRPKDQKVTTKNWGFRIKEDVHPDGTRTKKAKERFCVPGFEQVQGVDINATCAPVVKDALIRALMALVAHMDRKFHKMEVVKAFLNGEVEEGINKEIPDGTNRDGNSDLVCKLVKALSGLKQAQLDMNRGRLG